MSLAQVAAEPALPSRTCPAQNPNSVWTYGSGQRFAQRHAAAVPDQGPLRRADPHPHLQQHCRSTATQNGGFGRNETPAALPQRAQRRGERRRRQRAPLPRHVLRLPLEHHARPPRQDQHRRDRHDAPRARTATAASSTSPATSASCRAPCGRTTTASSSPPRMSTRAISCMVNYYSGPDRGNEALTDGVNLRLPSGKLLDCGNIDFDVNLIISDAAIRSRRPAVLRHLHHRRLPRRPAARQLRLCAVLGGAAAQVPLPHPQCLHVAVLPVRASPSPNGTRGAVPVHRQRRQPRRQPDHADRRSTSRASPSATTSSSTSPRSRSATGSIWSTC